MTLLQLCNFLCALIQLSPLRLSYDLIAHILSSKEILFSLQTSKPKGVVKTWHFQLAYQPERLFEI